MLTDLFTDIVTTSIKLYALMTPPAVLSAFLSHTKNYSAARKRKVSLHASAAIFILGLTLYVWGARMFELFGFTLDAFRIGSGVLLFLNALSLMKDEEEDSGPLPDGDISVVPLAVPLGMGPASIGAVTVLGAQATSPLEIWAGILALLIATLGMYLLLRMADLVSAVLRASGIAVLAKLTGLLLAALAAQVIFTGVSGFLEL